MAFGGAASAHPHVWVTVRSQIVFAPDGKVAAIVHDWVFDEMYSSFATQGLAKPGELVKREIFAPLAQENAGGLAEIGYFTTLKLDGKAVEFAPVTEYWMEERPDHLVAFHVVLPLKTPPPVGRFGFAAGRRSRIFHRLRIRRHRRRDLEIGAVGLLDLAEQAQTARRRRQDRSSSESFFSGLAPGTNFGFKMASRVIIACP